MPSQRKPSSPYRDAANLGAATAITALAPMAALVVTFSDISRWWLAVPVVVVLMSGFQLGQELAKPPGFPELVEDDLSRRRGA